MVKPGVGMILWLVPRNLEKEKERVGGVGEGEGEGEVRPMKRTGGIFRERQFFHPGRIRGLRLLLVEAKGGSRGLLPRKSAAGHWPVTVPTPDDLRPQRTGEAARR